MVATNNPFRNSAFRSEPEITQSIIDKNLHSMTLLGTILYAIKLLLVGICQHSAKPIAYTVPILVGLYVLFNLLSNFLSSNPDVNKVSVSKGSLGIEKTNANLKAKAKKTKKNKKNKVSK